MWKLRNPIPDAVQTNNLIYQASFKKFGIVPYFGWSEGISHGWLRYIKDACRLSPSYQSCRGSIEGYAFGGSVEVDAKLKSSLKTLGFNEKWIRDKTKKLFCDESDSGNCYLKVRLANVGGQWRVSIKEIDSLRCGYALSKDGNSDFLVIVQSWDENTWQNSPPQVIAVTKMDGEMMWSSPEKGVFETVIHKRTHSESDFYGESPCYAILNHLLTDHFLGQLIMKTANTDVVTRAIALVEKPPPENEPDGKPAKGFDSSMMAVKGMIKEVFTNEGGDPSSFAVWGYPNGTEKPEIITLNINRDPKFNESSFNISKSAIYSRFDWSPVLSGQDKISSGIGGNAFIDMAMVKNETKIIPLQEEYQEMWETCFAWINMVMEKETLPMGGIKFSDKLSTVVEKLQAINGTGKANI